MESSIARTIESVLSQNVKNIEYIIVDGASTDSTFEIATSYYKKVIDGEYPNKTMRVLSEPDLGIYDAMNKGIRMSSGDIIGIINADDWYEPNAISMVLNSIPSGVCQYIIHGGLNIVADDGSKECYYVETDAQPWDNMPAMHPTCFVSRSVYEEIGLFDLNYHIVADFDFLLRCRIKNVPFIGVDKVIANFSTGGISSTSEMEVEAEDIAVCMKYLDRMGDTADFVARRMERLKNKFFANSVYSVLNKLIPDGECVIFGTGVWGNKMHEICKKSDVKVLFFVDNNSKKWNEIVVNPENLKQFNGTVIVSIRNYEEEIKRQVLKYQNNRLTILTLSEIFDACLNEVCSNSDRIKKAVDELMAL